ncbi:GFA family protein [uncultured Maricaulis sp.]|uniref:GFA family protein n=1 Tax=uncultured Maricaulis sp. TaxID=174710 RepID=UPI0030D6F730|tara:strand:- start:35257 stop:35712 length:456 start_codon:yes stop_codon:yes gene_type:complete
MSLPVLPLKGTCRCGDVGVELTAPPLMTAACHCTGCQKMSASAFSITAMVPPDGFAVTRGQTERGGLGEGPIDHRCCPRCLTWMFTRIEGVDGFINIRPTMFDDTSWFTPFIETMTQEKLAWATTPARHSFAGFPPMDALPALIAEFAETA